MDATDQKIVGILQHDGRISLSDLAEQIPLSPSATSERLKRLTKAGVIEGFYARVSAEAIGRPIKALIDIRLQPNSGYTHGDDWLQAQPAVTDAVHRTGRFDLQLTVATRDVHELDQLLGELKEHMKAEETNTTLVLRQLVGFPRAPAL